MTITTGVKLVLFGWWIGFVCGEIAMGIAFYLSKREADDE